MHRAYVARGFIPAGLRSRWILTSPFTRKIVLDGLRAASQPSGDKSPRHKVFLWIEVSQPNSAPCADAD
jgi:hypothetical protein